MSSPLPAAPRIIDPAKTFEGLVSEVQEILRVNEAPGVIIGVSGTDSLLTFLICAEACKRLGMPERIIGIHYGEKDAPFSQKVLPWLKQQVPEADIKVIDSFGERRDGLRWGDMMDRSIMDVTTGGFWPKGKNYWVVGTQNATEQELRSYSNISRAVSLQPIMGLWKSEVLRLCSHLKMPDMVITASGFAVCGCGNPDMDIIKMQPKLVDAILMTRKGLISPDYLEKQFRPEDVHDAEGAIDRITAKFKDNIPYRVSPRAVVYEASKPVQ
jgi:NH3-dependent NAD+ synthetase